MQVAVDMLSDGEWHDREPILRAMAKTVPPGFAKRAQLDGERWSNNGATGAKSDADLIQQGQRRVAGLTLLRAKRIERRVVDGVTQVRMRPPKV